MDILRFFCFKACLNPSTRLGKGVKHGKANDPKTWTSFDDALTAFEKGKYNGIGFVFTGTPFVAVDIDGCYDPRTKAFSQLAHDIADRLDSYTEYSQSGRGLHIIVKGKLPAGRRRNDELGVEMYGDGSNRYFAMTGATNDEGATIRECQADIDSIHAEYIQREKPPQKQRQITTGGADRLLDYELLTKARKAKNGAEFAALYDYGDVSAYHGDDSGADQALCNHLAFWTGRDVGRMDALFRQSALMRPKWNEQRGSTTYGAMTIQRAIDDCRSIYDPHSPEQRQKRTDRAKVDFMQQGGVVTINPAESPENLKRYSFNDRGNGYLFADSYKNLCRYCPEAKEWYTYDGKAWRLDMGAVKAREYAKKLSIYLYDLISGIQDDNLREDFKSNAASLSRLNKRDAMLKDAQSVYPLYLSRLDADANLFNCKNGTMHLDNYNFTPHTSSDALSKISGVSYSPDLINSRWCEFIDEITEGDRDKALFLQKAVGYTLTGVPAEESLFILYGPSTRNGKGVFMTAIVKMLGEYAKTARAATLAARNQPNSGNPSEDVARLRGARLVNINEPSKSMRFDEALVKTLTGRDTINARFLHQNSFDFEPQFVIMINTNHRPGISDDTLFSSGRVHLIPFGKHFEDHEQDKHLKDKLTRAQALSGVFNWALDGLRLYKETGLHVPESVAKATAEYRHDSDKIAQFMDECTEAKMGGAVSTSIVYDHYQNWCRANGIYAESRTKFTTSLKNKGFKVDIGRWNGSASISHIWGISLVPQGIPSQSPQ